MEGRSKIFWRVTNLIETKKNKLEDQLFRWAIATVFDDDILRV
jgi:hypothetical protein